MIEKYRKDIDGLRAVAVILVILDHFKFSLFSGGYIGVDVFFVISGFLITKSICNDLQSETFTFKQFYVRRIRRLFPAMAFTILLSFAAALVFLAPDALVEYCRSAQASIFAVSNIYFWHQTGYFDLSANSKPLLHTWSLSVEEQFYLFWPALLILLGAKAVGRRFLIQLILLLVLSFGISELILFTDASAAYYLMPSRIFEFAIGAIAVFIKPPKKYANFASFFAIAALLATATLMNKFSRFPGAMALVPCLATAILLICKETFISEKILSSKAFSYVGRLSYSWYLIHWPVFVFINGYAGHLDLSLQVGGILLSFALASFSYHFIETPFRTTNFRWWRTHSYMTFGTWIILTALIFAPIKFAESYNGLDSRLSREALGFIKDRKVQLKEFKSKNLNDVCWLWQEQDSYSASVATFTKNHCYEVTRETKNVLVFGDSHSAHLYGALKEKFPEYNFYMLTGGDCDFSELYTRTRQTCKAIYDLMHKIDLNKFDYLITGIRIWYDFRSKDILDRVKETVKNYKGQVLYFGPVPYYGTTLMDTIYLQKFTPSGKEDPLYIENKFKKLIDPNSFHIEEVISTSLKKDSSIKFISILKHFCHSGISSCNPFTKNGQPILIDETHLSPNASRDLINSLSQNGELAL